MRVKLVEENGEGEDQGCVIGDDIADMSSGPAGCPSTQGGPLGTQRAPWKKTQYNYRQLPPPNSYDAALAKMMSFSFSHTCKQGD